MSYPNRSQGSNYGQVRRLKSGYGGRGHGKPKRQSFQPDLENKSQGVMRFLPEPIGGIVKVDETENEFRFRVVDPEGFVEFRNTDFDGKLPEGVSVVRAMTPEGVWVTQSVRFAKMNFGFDSAQEWLREHEGLFASEANFSSDVSER